MSYLIWYNLIFNLNIFPFHKCWMSDSQYLTLASGENFTLPLMLKAGFCFARIFCWSKQRACAALVHCSRHVMCGAIKMSTLKYCSCHISSCTSYYILYLYKDDLAHKETFTCQKQQLPIVRRRPIYPHSRRPNQSAPNTKPRLMVKRGRKQEKHQHQQKEPFGTLHEALL